MDMFAPQLMMFAPYQIEESDAESTVVQQKEKQLGTTTKSKKIKVKQYVCRSFSLHSPFLIHVLFLASFFCIQNHVLVPGSCASSMNVHVNEVYECASSRFMLFCVCSSRFMSMRCMQHQITIELTIDVATIDYQGHFQKSASINMKGHFPTCPYHLQRHFQKSASINIKGHFPTCPYYLQRFFQKSASINIKRHFLKCL